MKIYFDYHKEDEFGQITVLNGNDEKIKTVNMNIKEGHFEVLYTLMRHVHQNNDYFEYGYL